jgi:bis(5'-nucleosyl)-tetraphosphatase (symmetrical)
MEFQFKGELADVPAPYRPWFSLKNRATQGTQVIFGHWSALGLQQQGDVYALDTGCLWGGQLTAMNLQTKAISQVPSDPRDNPKRLKL